MLIEHVILVSDTLNLRPCSLFSSWLWVEVYPVGKRLLNKGATYPTLHILAAAVRVLFAVGCIFIYTMYRIGSETNAVCRCSI